MPSISDLPLEINSQILENLEPWDFIKSQRVCKGFKEIVDHHISLQKSWNFCCEPGGTTEVYHDSNTRSYKSVYSKTDSGCEAIYSIEDEDDDVEIKKTFPGKDPNEIAIEHFGVVARNPKVRLNESFLVLDAAREDLLFKKVFDRMEHKLHIRSLEFFETPLSIVRRVLSHVQPGFLEEIWITDSPEGEEEKKIAMEISEMDHWRLAKQLNSGGFDMASSFPIDDLLHAEKFYIDLRELTVEDLVRVREKLFQSPNFKKAFIRHDDELTIDDYTVGLGPPIRRDSDSLSYKIPGTEEYLDFLFKKWTIEITRS